MEGRQGYRNTMIIFQLSLKISKRVELTLSLSRHERGRDDGYYVAYKPITLSCILFMFIEMKFIHCHSCVMFAMKSMSMCNDYVNYDEIII